MINIAIYINNEFVHQKTISTRSLQIIKGLINFTKYIQITARSQFNNDD
jgi:hypothetical protein